MARLKFLARVFLFLLALSVLISCGGSVSANPNSLVILTNVIASALQGSNYTATLQASGGTPPYSWSVTAGQLPAGVVFAANGTISGVPRQSGTFNFTASAKDTKGTAASQALSLKVTGPLAIATTSLPPGSPSVAYSTTLQANGGASPYTWSITSGQLPAGLALNANTGAIAGTPTQAGTTNFTVQAKDANGATASAALQLVVSSSLTITTATVPNGTVGIAYSAQLAATGGTSPYAWSLASGSLPAGLSLSSAGVINGTPTTVGPSTFSVRVTDSASATKTASITTTVVAALAITTTSLPSGTIAVNYSQTLAASGGTTPYRWAITSGALPTGLSLSSGGVISGTPTAAGTFSFTVQVTDAASTTKTANLAISISSLSITNTSLPGGVVGNAYQASLTATGGTTPYTWAVSSGSLPAGLSLSTSGTISGTPTTAASYTFTVRVTDAAASTKTATFTVVINGVLTITTTSLPGGTIGAAYQQTLTASGGTTPYTWSLASGTLPAGLSLASNGTISGTPTTAASYTLTMRVTDAAAAQKTATFTITVSAASAQQYTMGTAVYPYSTQAKPARGASYTDSTFHLPVTRVTDVAAEGVGSIQVNYSTWNPLSSDGNYLLFQGNQGYGGFHLYNAHTFAWIRSIPYISWWNGQDPEPRWDGSGAHPTWIYYRKDKQLRYYDVADQSDHLVRDFTADFPTYGSTYYIYNGQEGSPSRDSRYWAFMIRNGSSPYQTVRVFVYDKTTNTVVSSKDVTGHDPNNVMMSPSGNYVFVSYAWTGHNDEFDGPHVYTKTFTNPIHVFTGIPHANFGWTKQGHEVVVGAGNDIVLGSDYFGFVRLDNGQGYTLDWIDNLGWNSDGMNAAYTDNQGWVFFSTYGGVTGNPDWSKMQVFAYELDETKTFSQTTGKTAARVWRIAFTQCFGRTYDEQANAAIDYSGTRIWWGSNWRSDGGPMDIYQVNLPATWLTDLAALPGTANTAPSSGTSSSSAAQR